MNGSGVKRHVVGRDGNRAALARGAVGCDRTGHADRSVVGH